MNKKLLAFISLFSLTLVLGVYYVMVPFSVPNNNDDSLGVNVIIDEGEDAYFVSLELEKENEYDLYVSSQYEIIFSSEEENSKKVDALKNIENVKDLKTKEKELKKQIEELGYEIAFVRIKDESVRAIVSKKEPTVLDAASVIGKIKNYCQCEKVVEVSFK